MTPDRRLKAYQDLHEASSLSSCSEDLMVAILEILLQMQHYVELRNIYINASVFSKKKKSAQVTA